MDYINQIVLLIATCGESDKKDILNKMKINRFIDNIDEDTINSYLANDEQELFDIFTDTITDLDNEIDIIQLLKNVEPLVIEQIKKLDVLNNDECIINMEETLGDFICGYTMY